MNSQNIIVKVIPHAKHNIIKEEDGRLKVYLTVPAIEGRANKALVEFLADHFHVRKSYIEIIQGLKSREKVVRIVSEDH